MQLDKRRLGFFDSLSDDEIVRIREDKEISTLQTSEPFPEESIEKLNDKLFRYRPDIEFRVFGFYGKVCDLSFAEKLSFVSRFSADCLKNAVNVESVSSMKNLEELSIGILNLENLNFLGSVSGKLKKLALWKTKQKKLDLSALRRFTDLETLRPEGHTKNIESLSKLGNLQELTLRSVTVSDLNFLVDLEKLWSFALKLGGTTDLSALTEVKNLKYLEIWQVRNLCDISFIPIWYRFRIYSCRACRK